MTEIELNVKLSKNQINYFSKKREDAETKYSNALDAI